MQNNNRLMRLHDLVLAELLDKVDSGEATAAELSLAIKFLKDNNVCVDLSKPSSDDKAKIAQIPRLNRDHLNLA